MAENEQNTSIPYTPFDINGEQWVMVPECDWLDMLEATREKHGETIYYKSDEVAPKIRAIGTRDTLAEFFAEQIDDIVYYGDSIPAYACSQMKNLNSFIAPNLTNIPGYCLESSGVRYVNCENVTSVLGQCNFTNCKNLIEINLPKLQSCSVNQFLTGCSALERVVFPSLVKFASYMGLSGCTSLKTVILPVCIEITGGSMMGGSTSLTTLVVGTSNCKLGATTILPSNFLNIGTIYVPDEAVDWYKSATNWSTYADIIKPMSELPTEVTQ